MKISLSSTTFYTLITQPIIKKYHVPLRIMQNLIHFDWAIKKLLRDKANFVVLEGFLTVVLNQQIKIVEILESESNQEEESDKFNKVDLLVKDQKGELIIIEVQNNQEYDYFQRMLYGTSKVITEHLNKKEKYSELKKVYSITIAYFDLGQGIDYVYYGKTEFTGIHNKELLTLPEKQIELFQKNHAKGIPFGTIKDIYPEYYIIKAGKFNDQKVSDKLDDWIYFLKNSKIPESFTASGLKEAREVLAEMKMSASERKAYEAFNKRLRDIASANFTKEAGLNFARKEGREEGIEIGMEKGMEKTALNSIKAGLDNDTISKITGLAIEEIEKLRK